jgi:hypothetical protein
VEKGLIVLEPYIKTGLFLFYQVAFEYESFDFIVCEYEIQVPGQASDQPYLGIFLVRILEIGLDPVFQVVGFANI